jgi:hypothetical protein
LIPNHVDSCLRPESHDGHKERRKCPDFWLEEDGPQSEAEMHFLGTITDMLDCKAGCWNCLDLTKGHELPSSILWELIPSVLLNSTDNALSRATDAQCADQNYKLQGLSCAGPPLTFSLFGKGSAVSRIHIDSEGACTYVKIESGSKLWFIMVKSAPSEPGSDEIAELGSPHNFCHWYKAKWDVAFLEPGDIM